MAQMKVPKQTSPSILEVDSLYGCDLTSSGANVNIHRSPDCPNMIRESIGKVRKRTGYHTLKTYSARINGVHTYKGEIVKCSTTISGGTVKCEPNKYSNITTDDRTFTYNTDHWEYTVEGVATAVTLSDYGITITGTPSDTDTISCKFHNDARIIHSGTNIYLDNGGLVTDDELLYSTANDAYSKAYQVGGYLVFLDGKKMLLIGNIDKNGLKAVTAETKAYIPTIVIARNPTTGGGTSYEPVNLIGTGRKDSFLGDTSTKYQLSSTTLMATTVTAKLLQSDGTYQEMTEGAGFSVDRTTGKVTFDAAHPTPITGEDNVIITYHVETEGYADRINKCNIATIYGENGARNRIFCSGNSEYSNRDWYCQQDDPTYWGDIWYSTIGQDGATIMGYSIVSEKLVTILDASENEMNFILRSPGSDDEGATTFALSGAYQGTGSISRYAFDVLKTEPIFLTKQGMFAVTPSDVLGERFAQERSYYLRGKLQELDLTDCYGKTIGDFYYLSVGTTLYILDGLQASTERNDPYSSRQYECYYWEGIDARVLYDDEGLCFGSNDGKLCKFYEDINSIYSYNDDGEPIESKWTTAEIYGKYFYYKKKFRKVSVLLAAAVNTGTKVYACYDGIKELITDYTSDARYFSFSNLVFSKLSFKSSQAPQQIRERMSIKPDDRSLYMEFINGVINEPFGIYEIALEFTETRG